VHQVSSVRGDRRAHPRVGQPDPELGVGRHGQRPHPDHRVAQLVIGARPPPGRLGRDDQHLVAAAGQFLDDAHSRVRDAVHIGRERLSDIRDSHAQTLRDAAAGQSAGPWPPSQLWMTSRAACGRRRSASGMRRERAVTASGPAAPRAPGGPIPVDGRDIENLSL
jgi:hypothetical protein